MDPLRIHLLGGFLLEKGDRVLPPISSRAGRSLFAYLAVNRGRRQMRDLLAGLFWPEVPESRARRRLSHTLWQIQDALSEVADPQRYLVVTTDALAFRPEDPTWVDVEEFERTLGEVGLVRGGRPLSRSADLEVLRSCVELYRGDFMAGFYEDWVLLEQERLRELYLRALEQLVQLAKGRGSHEEALTYARRLTHHDPLREEGHQEVMRLCFLLGRMNEALQQYERCRSVLAEELGAEPSPPTVELYEKILRYRGTGMLPAEGGEGPLFRLDVEIPFVGREREREVLVDRMEQVLGGRGGVLLVEGEPGVGKTRLVREAVDDARWRGFEALWGPCEDPSSTRPYQALATALATGVSPLRAEQLGQQVDGVWLRETARVVPRLAELLPDLPPRASLRAEEEPERMREALVRTFLALGAMAPLLLVIDDLQWADPDTLRVLVRLAERSSGRRILMAVTYRDDEARQRPEVWEAVRALDRLGGRGRVLLAPLTAFETGELVRRSLDRNAVHPRFTARLHAETSGNPLFVLETVRALHESDPGQDVFEEASLPLASGVYGLVADRVGRLSPEVRAVLEVAAVDAGELELSSLLGSAAGSREEVVGALDQLLRRGYLIEEGGRYRFNHEMVRRVVYREMPEAARRRLHAGMAEVLEAVHPDHFERIAHHFRMAGEPGRALGHLARAGERAVGLHAYETAATHYGEAVALAEEADSGAEEASRLLGAYEAVLDVLGRRDLQQDVLDRMESLAGHPAELAEVSLRRTWLLAHTGRFEEAERIARETLVIAEQEGDARLRAGALRALGMTLSWAGHTGEAITHLAEAVQLPQDDSRDEAEARYALGNALSYVERYEEAVEELERSLELHRQAGDVRGEAEALGMLAVVQMERGETRGAERSYREALELCRAIGYRHGEGRNLVNLANVLYVQSRVSDAVASLESASLIFRESLNRRGEAMVCANLGTMYHRLMGDDERAVSQVDHALAYFREAGDERGEAQCLDVLGGVARREGRVRESRRLLEEGLEKARRSGRRWLEAQLLPSLALLALDEGRPGEGLDHLEEARGVCRELGMDDQAVAVEGLRARVLVEEGRTEEALSASGRAVERLGPGVEQGYLVWWWRHEVAVAAGLPAEAHRALEAAHDGLTEALAGLDADRRALALERVPEHRAIVGAWEEHRPVRVSVALAREDAPLGRSLQDEDLVEVEWTVEDPADRRTSDRVELRRRKVLRLLREAARQGASPTVDDLAGVLEVSPATVKRDLRRLREGGHDVRTRGSRPAAG